MIGAASSATRFTMLHRSLPAVVANGDQILSVLESHCNRETVDINRLYKLLKEQQSAFAQVKHIIESKNLPDVLSIHAPALDVLWVLVEQKEGRLRLLRSRVEYEAARREWDHPADLQSPVDRIDYPPIESVVKSRLELNRLGEQVEELRKFVANELGIGDVS